jgi:hypothetical protein
LRWSFGFALTIVLRAPAVEQPCRPVGGEYHSLLEKPMNPKTKYVRPEVVEIGPAMDLTLGDPLLPCADNCGCHAKAAEEEF